MEKTPNALRKHIVIIGETNTGKSTLYNTLIGQEASIVSENDGTTTDPVIKAMELIPYGPVAIIDTAGLGDTTPLGEARMKKTMQVLSRADVILCVTDATTPKSLSDFPGTAPKLLVFTKCDLLDEDALLLLKKQYSQAIFLSDFSKTGMDSLKERLIAMLEKQTDETESLLGDLLTEGSCVVMVIPIDSAAPKGRLILPQVQLLRDCLDHNIKAYVTNEMTLKSALEDLKQIDLVVTDSQIFPIVDKQVPSTIPLTSFSMLLARQKGNFEQYLSGAKAFESLKNGSRILIMEGCTHNTTHEDIGRVKIPALIEKKLGIQCEYHVSVGYDFPEDISQYDLVLSCGMCMINKQENLSRLKCFQEKNLPVVNYGVALAYLTGILDRAKEIFIR